MTPPTDACADAAGAAPSIIPPWLLRVLSLDGLERAKRASRHLKDLADLAEILEIPRRTGR